MGKHFILAVFYLSLILLLSGICSAQIDTYNISFYMAFNQVVVKESMIFNSPQTRNMEFNIPLDAKGISLRVDGKLIKSNLTRTEVGERFNIDLESANNISLSYITSEFIDGNDFIMTFRAPDDISNLYVDLTLPENAVLQTPFSDSTFSSGSAYPRPSQATTDGRSITLKWEFDTIAKDDPNSFFVRYKNQGTNLYMPIMAFAGIMIIFGLVYFLFARKKKEKNDEEEIEAIEEEAEDKGKEVSFEKHLKEDEEQVVNILKQREGQCEQGTLRVITGFSKAKLSGLLKELEDRKIILKEKRGKKNLVFLREQ